jgi:hypothetical protein
MLLQLLHEALLILKLRLLVGDLLLQDGRLLCHSCLAAAKSLLHLLKLDCELLNNLAAAAAAAAEQHKRTEQRSYITISGGSCKSQLTPCIHRLNRSATDGNVMAALAITIEISASNCSVRSRVGRAQ